MDSSHCLVCNLPLDPIQQLQVEYPEGSGKQSGPAHIGCGLSLIPKPLPLKPQTGSSDTSILVAAAFEETENVD